MKTLHIVAAIGFATGATGSAFALEPLKSYDKFASPPIDGTHWLTGETSIQVKNGQLVLSERLFGSQAADSGEHYDVQRVSMPDPSAVNEMKATITVNSLEVEACAANSTVGVSRARVSGAFFNADTPVPGSSVNDIVAQARVIRFSNSADADNVYRVQGVVFQCQSFDCNVVTTLKLVDLGTVSRGAPVTLEMQWDKANNRFLFTRDSGTAAEAAYAVSDSNPPGAPYKALDIRLDVANCTGSQAPTGAINASFDNVLVNRSAAP